MASRPAPLKRAGGRPPSHGARLLNRVLQAGRLDARTNVAKLRQERRNAIAADLGGWDVLSAGEVSAINSIVDKELVEAAYSSAALRELDGIARTGAASFSVRDWVSVSNSKGRDWAALRELTAARRAKGESGLDLDVYLRAHAETAAETHTEPVCATITTNGDTDTADDAEGRHGALDADSGDSAGSGNQMLNEQVVPPAVARNQNLNEIVVPPAVAGNVDCEKVDVPPAAPTDDQEMP